MKHISSLFVAFAVLISITLSPAQAADPVTSYYGKTFSTSDSPDAAKYCQLELVRLRKVFTSAQLTVLDVECVESNFNATVKFRSEVVYSHSYNQQIRSESIYINDINKCEDLVGTSEIELRLNTAGFYLLDALCKTGGLTLTYLRKDSQIPTTLEWVDTSPFFSTGDTSDKTSCDEYSSSIQKSLNAAGVYPILSICNRLSRQEFRNDPPRLVTVSGYFSKTLFGTTYEKSALVFYGKTYPQIEACQTSLDESAKIFRNLGINLFDARCTKNNYGLLQHVFQMIDDSLLPRLRTQEGPLRKSQDSCNSILESMSVHLADSGNQVVYSFCEKNNENSWKPILKYVRME